MPSLPRTVDKDTIINALKRVNYPGYSRDIVSFGLVQNAAVNGTTATVALSITTSDPEIPKRIRSDAEAALRAAGFASVEITVTLNAPASAPRTAAAATPPPMTRPAGVRRVIAVASGKGGVGKSTFSVNLACALARLRDESDGEPLRVGLLDCDIHGPSIPLMMGISGQPEVRDNALLPHERYGVKVMSLGFLIDDDAPVIWRGPMIMKTIQQFVTQVEWHGLDVLVIDLPPGTGDAPLSLAQTVLLDGVLIVTTPQPAAANVARRGAAMFPRMNVPLLGVAENMSWLALPGGARQALFGTGGGAAVAAALDTELLGQVPLDPAIREGGDTGVPLVVSHPESEASVAFAKIAARVCERLAAAD